MPPKINAFSPQIPIESSSPSTPNARLALDRLMSVKSVALDDHTRWQWKEKVSGDLTTASQEHSWRTARSFPSEIHVELLAEGLIPDPFVEFNEHKVQCMCHECRKLSIYADRVAGIGEREWLYRYSFNYEQQIVAHPVHQEIRFEGLDTLCDVYLVSCV